MFCHKCGAELNEDAEYCYMCGEKVGKTDDIVTTVPKSSSYFPMESPSDSPIGLREVPCCPNCNSQDLIPIPETEVNVSGGGYSAGKGCLGWLLFGPFGLLCGLCGSGRSSVTKTRTFWLCRSCGYKFRDPKEEKQEKITSGIMAMLFFAFGLPFMFIIASWVFDFLNINFLGLSPEAYSNIGGVGFSLGVIGIILFGVGSFINHLRNKNKK